MTIHYILASVCVLCILLFYLVTSRECNILLGHLTWRRKHPWRFRWTVFQKQLPKIRDVTADIYIVYHIGTVNNYRAVVAEQMAELQTSGLYDLCRAILVGANGPGCQEFTAELSQRYSKVELLSGAIIPTPKTYERETLNGLIRWVQTRKDVSDDAMFCYMHSKGVTQTTNAQPSWRRIMMYWIVQQHEYHRRVLAQNRFYTSGIFLSNVPCHFYSGNFFWATAKYVRMWVPLPSNHVYGRFNDESLCLQQAQFGRHIVIVPKATHRFMHFSNYFDEDPIIPDPNPWICIFPS